MTEVGDVILPFSKRRSRLKPIHGNANFRSHATLSAIGSPNQPHASTRAVTKESAEKTLYFVSRTVFGAVNLNIAGLQCRHRSIRKGAPD
jgi:hypothetical protein